MCDMIKKLQLSRHIFSGEEDSLDLDKIIAVS